MKTGQEPRGECRAANTTFNELTAASWRNNGAHDSTSNRTS
jgi:hypothetical protein